MYCTCKWSHSWHRARANNHQLETACNGILRGISCFGKKILDAVPKKMGTQVSNKNLAKVCNRLEQCHYLFKCEKMHDEVYIYIYGWYCCSSVLWPGIQPQPQYLKTKYLLTHPEMCLVVDEVWINISQRGGGHVDGQNMCVRLGLFLRTNYPIMPVTSQSFDSLALAYHGIFDRSTDQMALFSIGLPWE